MTRFPPLLALLALSLLGLPACTQTDDILQAELGVLRLQLIQGGLTAQFPSGPGAGHRPLDSDPGIQSVNWEITAVDLQFGDVSLDLRGGDECVASQSYLTLPNLDGRCAGIVIPGSQDPVPVTLALALEMELRRVEPLILPIQGDFDMDGEPNGADNCPLIPNGDCSAMLDYCDRPAPRWEIAGFGVRDGMLSQEELDEGNQADADGNGLGDACTGISLLTGLLALDTDGDGITDDVDNCVYFPNASQDDAIPTGWVGPDGIGDACPAESTQVKISGTSSLVFNFPPMDTVFDFPPVDMPGGQVIRFLTVSFGDVRALNCDWTLGECELDPAQVSLSVSQ